MKVVLLSLLGALWLGLSMRAAEACSCIQTRLPCEALQRATVAFVGTVGASRETGPDGQHATPIAVEEVLVGELGKTAVVRSRWNGASCDPRLGEGARLLFYAIGTAPDQLHLGCQRLVAVADAADELKYLRAHKRKATGVVMGTVSLKRGAAEAAAKPLAGALVRVHGSKVTGRTGADGRYRLELPPGRYSLEVDAPPDTLVSSWPAGGEVTVGNVGACTALHFVAASNGRIRGRVTDHLGQPVAGLEVRGLRGEQRYQARTDASGDYQLERLPPGDYVVGVALESDPKDPRSLERVPRYFPGVAHLEQAQPVSVAEGQVTSSIDLQLAPPRPMRVVSLHVTQGGAPTRKEVWVHETRTRRELWRGPTDAEGSISFPWPAGKLHWDVCVIEEQYKVAHSCVTMRRELRGGGVEVRPQSFDVDVTPPWEPIAN